MDTLKDNFYKINSLILTLNYVNPRNRLAYYRKFILRKRMLKTIAKILKPIFVESYERFEDGQGFLGKKP